MARARMFAAIVLIILIGGASAPWAFARGASDGELEDGCSMCYWAKWSNGNVTHVWWERCGTEMQDDLAPASGPNSGIEDGVDGSSRAAEERSPMVEDPEDSGNVCARCPDGEEYADCVAGGDGTPAYEDGCPTACRGGALQLQLVAHAVSEAERRADVPAMSRILTANMTNVHFLRAAGVIEVRTCEGRLVERITVSPEMSVGILNAG